MAVNPEREVRLNEEVAVFETAENQVLLGDLDIRRRFARQIMLLFAATNAFVMAGLGVVFAVDCVQIGAKQIAPTQRIVNQQVIMALLGATTVQLGTVVYTITRAIFPGSSRANGRRGRDG